MKTYVSDKINKWNSKIGDNKNVNTSKATYVALSFMQKLIPFTYNINRNISYHLKNILEYVTCLSLENTSSVWDINIF